MSAVRIRFVGADLFCPDCRRWLAGVAEGGTPSVAAKAVAHVNVDMDSSEWAYGEVEHVISDATCLRWRCRARAFVRRLPCQPKLRYTRRT